MAFCTNCGAQLPEGTKFCGNCGAKQEIRTPVQTAATAAAPEPAVPVQEPPQEEAPCACAAAPVEQADAIPAQQSYTAPVQQSYTPPTQQSYTAPVQQSYTAAAQESYTPPVQQSYTPPTQESYTAAAQQSYTPPTQESYTAAAQQSYTAPAQESYTPPTQQSYTPPVQQSAAPQDGAGARRAPQPVIVASKPKKPLNRKLLFIIGGAVLAVILAVVLICTLGGKGGGAAAADPNLGVYTASTAEMLGVEMDITDLFEEGVSIELKENGKCAMNVNGTKGSGKWTLEDGVFHIKGGGLDCDGTLESGVMTLENMLGMGVQMTFVKEGGFTPADPDSAADSGSAAGSGSAAAAAPASALQQQWAGTWYGCMYVSEATGDFAGIPSDFYDAYMVVDVDAEGKGTFAVYVAGSEEAFALANCEAKESGLYATDGTIAGGIEMYAYNWMFLPMPDYPDQYVMGDEIQDGDSSFTFSLFMKQWGGSWQKELDSGFAIVPPSIAGYNDAIANGELPPYGFAPAGYAGSGAPAGADGESAPQPGEVPDDRTEPQDSGYGMSVAGADGIVPLDTLIAAGKYCNEYRTEVTYDDVYSRMGNVHGAPKTDAASWEDGVTHVYSWSASTGEYIFIVFRIAEDGVEYWSSMSNTMGLLK